MYVCMYVCMYSSGELRGSAGQDLHVRGPQQDRLLRGLQEIGNPGAQGRRALLVPHTNTSPS